MPMKKTRGCPDLLVRFPDQNSANDTPGPSEENKTKAPKSVTPKPSKKAKQTTVPGMKPTEVGEGEIPLSPAISSKPWADCMQGHGTYFGPYRARAVQKLRHILKGFSVKWPMGHLGKEARLGKVSRWLRVLGEAGKRPTNTRCFHQFSARKSQLDCADRACCSCRCLLVWGS